MAEGGLLEELCSFRDVAVRAKNTQTTYQPSQKGTFWVWWGVLLLPHLCCKLKWFEKVSDPESLP